MKTSQNFGFLFLMLVIMQILICNFINLGPLVILSLLPALILCIPLTVGTVPAMFIAFFTGLAVDWLAEGIIGLNALSLVPVALCRKGIVQLFLGKDHIVRQENFSIRKNGFGKVSIAVISSLTLYLLIYITVDGAGTRPFLFNLIKFLISLIAGYLLSMIVTNVLTSGEKK